MTVVALPAGGSSSRDVLVTRPFCAIGGTAGPESAGLPLVFVDWLSINQVHPAGGLPEVDSGCVIGCGEDGEVEWLTARAVRHEGSFETSVSVRCDGHRVTFSGNASRFGRADNLFGFCFGEALRRVNAILAHYGAAAVHGRPADGVRRRWANRRAVDGRAA